MHEADSIVGFGTYRCVERRRNLTSYFHQITERLFVFFVCFFKVTKQMSKPHMHSVYTCNFVPIKLGMFLYSIDG